MCEKILIIEDRVTCGVYGINSWNVNFLHSCEIHLTAFEKKVTGNIFGEAMIL